MAPSQQTVNGLPRKKAESAGLELKSNERIKRNMDRFLNGRSGITFCYYWMNG